MSQRKKEEKKWVEEVWGFELAPSGFGGDSTVGNSHSEYRMVAALINAPTVQEKKIRGRLCVHSHQRRMPMPRYLRLETEVIIVYCACAILFITYHVLVVFPALR